MAPPQQKEDLSRRSFLALVGSMLAFLAGASIFHFWRRKTPSRLAGPNFERGHSLWKTLSEKNVSQAKKIPVVIIGGGVSGLSAAWYLLKERFTDFRLFELENKVGGNAQWGENRLSRYPWGAHYLPTPGRDAHYVRMLLEEMGVYKNGKYNEEALVHEIEERLFIYGNWQPGLLPLMGARESDRAQIQKFFDVIAGFRHAHGKDGKPAFTIPLALSSRDPRFTRFDGMTAQAFLDTHGITSKRLVWYVDYVLRDEYGSNRSNTSAWALIHYFAARGDAHNLVWPEGNGFLTEYLRRKTESHIQCATTLRHIEKIGKGYRLSFINHETNSEEIVEAQKIIYAAPKFTLPYVYPQLSSAKKESAKALTYSPWLTVNLLVNHIADETPAWDSVFFGSASLGYVVAEHQRMGKTPHTRSLTFYHAFDADDTLASRKHLLSLKAEDALRMALDELRPAHPHIDEQVEDAGVFRWAHGMVRPVPGFLTHGAREVLATVDTNFFGAHSDLSGISNFEEAQFQGISAAIKALI